MTLRETCIEAMAETWLRQMGNEIIYPSDLEDAAAALDALLGVLEEHADEWANATDGSGYSWYVRPTDASRLLAVLREDT